MPKSLCLFTILTAVSIVANAQVDLRTGFDTSYYVSYSDQITGRFYFSQKYTSIRMRGEAKVENLQYRPNTTLNMGVGVTYGWFTLNLAAGFGFLNQGDKEKGETNYLDLQTHIFGRRWYFDFLGQFYKGFYLHPKGLGANSSDQYYTRPDIRLVHLGVSAYRIMNWEQFSFRAPMVQSEWQKKSAGSWLLGAEAYLGGTSADSSLVPSSIKDQYKQKDLHQLTYLTIGPGGGYAYTLVYKENFYVMAALTSTLSLSIANEKMENQTEQTKASISPNLFFRAGLGYNSEKFQFSVMWVDNSVNTRGKSGDFRVSTGNVRLAFAHRFSPGPDLKRRLRVFEN